MFYMGISFNIQLPAIIRPARLSSGRSSGAGGAGAFLGCLSQGGCSPHFSCFFTCASSQAFEVLLCFLRCGARKIPPGSAVCAESIGAAAQVFYQLNFYKFMSYDMMALLSVQNTQTKTTYHDCKFRCWASTSVWKASEVPDSAKQFGSMKEKRNQGQKHTLTSQNISMNPQVHKLQDAWAEESQERTNL